MKRSSLNLSLPSDAEEWPAPGSPQEGLDLEQRLFLIDDEIAKLKRGSAFGAGLFLVVAVLLGVLFAWSWS